MKVRCDNCGDDFTLEPDNNPTANCCDECWQMLNNQGIPDPFDEMIDGHSDADPGL